MTTTQPPLFDAGPPQRVSTEALLRRLADLESVLRAGEYPEDRRMMRFTTEDWREIRAEHERIEAQLFSRGVGR